MEIIEAQNHRTHWLEGTLNPPSCQPVTAGVLQGTALLPALFDVSTNGLNDRIEGTQRFPDDTKLWNEELSWRKTWIGWKCWLTRTS